ncbi:MAG TPA: c-type cytochrome [Steroidobacteraceae bacterium]|jgi:cytochrome c oxidase cbb3-type subunit 3
MCSRCRIESLLLLAVLAVALSACSQHATPPPQSGTPGTTSADVIDSALDPGVDHSLSSVDPRADQYYDNPKAVQAGKLLFSAFNCSGCHSNGGGGMGPSLMDDEWIYGDRLEQIHQTIVQGRPNGMPAWGGKIPDQQIWQLAAYVRSLSLPATLAAQNGPTPGQTPAPIPRDAEQDAGWSPPDDATNHFTTTTKGPQ